MPAAFSSVLLNILSAPRTTGPATQTGEMRAGSFRFQSPLPRLFCFVLS